MTAVSPLPLPLVAPGDLIVAGSDSRPSRFPLGPLGTVIRSGDGEIEWVYPAAGGLDPAWWGAVYTKTPTTAQAAVNLTALYSACAAAAVSGGRVHIDGFLGINDEFLFPRLTTISGNGFYWGGTLADSLGSCIFDAGVDDYGALFRWGSPSQTEPHWYSRLERIGLCSENTTVETLAIRGRFVSSADYDSTRKGTLSEVWVVGGDVQLRWGPDPTPPPYASAHATGTYYSAHRFVTSGGRQYRCIRTGVSGGVAPAFPTSLYQTVEETNIAGLTAWTNGAAISAGEIRRNSGSTRVFICKVAGTTGGSEPAEFATAAVGGEVTDNTITWLRVNLAKWQDRGPVDTSHWEEQDDDFLIDHCYFSGFTYTVRANSTDYAVGDIRRDATGTDRTYRCTVAGRSDSSAPAAIATAAVGDVVVDGTATWVRIENPIGSLGGVVVNGANAADAATWRNCGFSGCSVENEAYVFIRGGFHKFENCYAGGDGTNTRIFIRLFSDVPMNVKDIQSEKMYATLQVPFDGDPGYLRAINLENCTFDDEVHILRSRRVLGRSNFFNTVSAGSPRGSRLVLGPGIRYFAQEEFFYDDRAVIIGASSFYVNMRGENGSATNGIYQQGELIWRLGAFASGQPLWYAVTQQGRESSTTRANTTPYALDDYIQNASGSHTFKVTTAGTTAGAEPGGVTTPTIGAATTDGTAVLTCVNTTPVLTPVGVVFSPSSAYSVTNRTTDRSYDANATTTDELADVLGTLILDLQARGILG